MFYNSDASFRLVGDTPDDETIGVLYTNVKGQVIPIFIPLY